MSYSFEAQKYKRPQIRQGVLADLPLQIQEEFKNNRNRPIPNQLIKNYNQFTNPLYAPTTPDRKTLNNLISNVPGQKTRKMLQTIRNRWNKFQQQLGSGVFNDIKNFQEFALRNNYELKQYMQAYVGARDGMKLPLDATPYEIAMLLTDFKQNGDPLYTQLVNTLKYLLTLQPNHRIGTQLEKLQTAINIANAIQQSKKQTSPSKTATQTFQQQQQAQMKVFEEVSDISQRSQALLQDGKYDEAINLVKNYMRAMDPEYLQVYKKRLEDQIARLDQQKEQYKQRKRRQQQDRILYQQQKQRQKQISINKAKQAQKAALQGTLPQPKLQQQTVSFPRVNAFSRNNQADTIEEIQKQRAQSTRKTNRQSIINRNRGISETSVSKYTAPVADTPGNVVKNPAMSLDGTKNHLIKTGNQLYIIPEDTEPPQQQKLITFGAPPTNQMNTNENQITTRQTASSYQIKTNKNKNTKTKNTQMDSEQTVATRLGKPKKKYIQPVNPQITNPSPYQRFGTPNNRLAPSMFVRQRNWKTGNQNKNIQNLDDNDNYVDDEGFWTEQRPEQIFDNRYDTQISGIRKSIGFQKDALQRFPQWLAKAAQQRIAASNGQKFYDKLQNPEQRQQIIRRIGNANALRDQNGKLKGYLVGPLTKGSVRNPQRRIQRMQRSHDILATYINDKQINDYVHPIVKQILSANAKIAEAGIGPISKNSLPLYVGRWMDPITGKINVLPKADNTLINPTSLPQRIAYTQAKILNNWNTMVKSIQEYDRLSQKNPDSYQISAKNRIANRILRNVYPNQLYKMERQITLMYFGSPQLMSTNAQLFWSSLPSNRVNQLLQIVKRYRIAYTKLQNQQESQAEANIVDCKKIAKQAKTILETFIEKAYPNPATQQSLLYYRKLVTHAISLLDSQYLSRNAKIKQLVKAITIPTNLKESDVIDAVQLRNSLKQNLLDVAPTHDIVQKQRAVELLNRIPYTEVPNSGQVMKQLNNVTGLGSTNVYQGNVGAYGRRYQQKQMYDVQF